MGAAAPIITAGAMLWSANEERKASKEAASQQEKLSDRASAAQRWAMPRLFGLLESEYAPRIGQESPLLTAAHERNVGEIEAGGQGRLAEIEMAFPFNRSRALGAKLREGARTDKLIAGENLASESGQESYRQGALDRYSSLLLPMATDQSWLQPAQQGVQYRAQGRAGFAENIAGGAGMLYGAYEEKRRRQQESAQTDKLVQALLG